MAGYAYPTTAYNSRTVTPREYEDLMHPVMPDGVYGKPSDPPLIYADGTGLNVKIRANRSAFIRALRWESGGAVEQIAIPGNSTAGTTRIDLIVLRMSRNPWTVAVVRIAGTATASPTTPSPVYGTDTSTGTWDLPLASVRVAYNATSIGVGDVTPLAWYIGDDGQILCTAATRPPHVPDRRIRETDTGRTLVSTGTQWVVLLGDTGSVLWNMASGWTRVTGGLQRRNAMVFGALTAQKTTGMSADQNYLMADVGPDFYPPFNFECTGHVVSQGVTVTAKLDDTGNLWVKPDSSVPAGSTVVVALPTWPAP